MTSHTMNPGHMNPDHGQETFEGGGERRALAGLRDRASAILKGVEYTQTVRALDSLPDHVLATAGLRRRDIPDHARRLIYGGGRAGA